MIHVALAVLLLPRALAPADLGNGADPNVPACVAYSATGPAWVESAGARRDLRTPDWIPAGSRVSVSTSGRVLLAFLSGARFELGPEATATIGARGLERPSGPIRPLPPLPALPRVEGLSGLAGTPAGAVRVRSGKPLVLRPGVGDRVPSEEVTLSYEAPDDLAGATVFLEDNAGHVLLQVETRSSRLQVPQGVLRPGERYYLRVRGTGAGGEAHSGESTFETLSAEAEKARRDLRSAVLSLSEPESAALLAAVDRSLGVPTAPASR